MSIPDAELAAEAAAAPLPLAAAAAAAAAPAAAALQHETGREVSHTYGN